MNKIYLLLILSILMHQSSATTKRVLFIGNSYTHYNSLPQMIASMASTTGDTLIYQQSTPGGYTLEAHSTNSNTLNLIAQGGYDFVVLQEQSQRPSFPDGQFYADTYPYAVYLDSLIHAYTPCAEVVFYETWGRENGDQSNCGFFPPLCTYEGMDSMLTLRYRTMAQDLGALISPVGEVWHRVRDLYYPGLQPYTSDGSHPSFAGSYIAASTFYTVFFEKDPMGVSYTGTLSATDAASIRAVAKSWVFDSLSHHIYADRSVPTVDSVEFSQLSQDSVYVYSNAQNADATYWVLGSDTIVGSEVMMYYDSLVAHNWSVTIVVTNCYGSTSYTQAPLGVKYTEPLTTQIVYPNPASNYLHLKGLRTHSRAQILDLTGRVILENEVETQKIDVSQLVSGAYILLLESDNSIIRVPWIKE